MSASVGAAGSPVNDSRRGSGAGERWPRPADVCVTDGDEERPSSCLEPPSAKADNRRVVGRRGQLRAEAATNRPRARGWPVRRSAWGFGEEIA